jgi:pimeloyl-ACP methyl ester carboxylesterase
MRNLGIALQHTAWVFCIMLVLSCKADRGYTVVQGTVDPLPDSCRFEPDHHYRISLPGHPVSKQKIPLVIAIDPHGDGFSAVQHFRGALIDLPVAVAGSMKLMNNYAGFEASLNNLYNDLIEKYPVDPDYVIVAGFSGGARMAFHYGMRNPVRGIIMFGAGPGQLPGSTTVRQIYTVTGTRDFNFIEQYRPLFYEPGNASYINDYFTGTHEWPPERYLLEAVVFCLRDGPKPFHALTRELSGEFLREYDSLQNAGNLLFAGKALEKAWYFSSGTSQQKNLTGKIDAIKLDPDWIACQQKMEDLLRSETSMKRMYADHLADPDTAWWSDELNNLYTRINDSRDPVERDYYYRLKGFLGIYLYTLIKKQLPNEDPGDLADRLIRIYEQVEPDSPDLVQFKAQRFSRRK